MTVLTGAGISAESGKVRCLTCDQTREEYQHPLPELPPECVCEGTLRPGVCWFGEGLDQGIWDNAEKAARTSEILLVVGTSAVVYPAASMVPVAKRAGAHVIEVNPDETPLTSSVDVTLRGPAGEMLRKLIV